MRVIRTFAAFATSIRIPVKSTLRVALHSAQMRHMGALRSVLVLVLMMGCGRTTLALEPPIAALTPTASEAVVGQIIRLDGSASEDPREEPLVCQWRIVSHPAGGVAVLDTTEMCLARLQPDAEGVWVVELVVVAGQRQSRPALATVWAHHLENHAPVAVANGPAAAVLGSEVVLNGLDSFDPDGDPLTFRWQLVSAPITVTPTTINSATARVSVSTQGSYEWELEVTDPFGLRSVDSVRFTASAEIDAGRADAGRDGGFALDAGPDVLLPTEIYILGSLVEGFCGRDALARLETPNIASVGFVCDFIDRPMAIHPQTGRLLQRPSLHSQIVTEYRCDVCQWHRGDTYPLNDVSLNDPVLRPSPSCYIGDFRVAPDGPILFSCLFREWRDATGAITSLSGLVIALGAGGWGLMEGSLNNYLTGAQLPITGLQVSAAEVLTVRWFGPTSSFMVVIAVMGEPELWMVSTVDGHATRVGGFSALPPSISSPFGGPVLDPSGRLFQQAHDDAHPLVDVVVRREVGGTSAVVYTEASTPLVKLNGSRLLTGP